MIFWGHGIEQMWQPWCTPFFLFLKTMEAVLNIVTEHEIYLKIERYAFTEGSFKLFWDCLSSVWWHGPNYIRGLSEWATDPLGARYQDFFDTLLYLEIPTYSNRTKILLRDISIHDIIYLGLCTAFDPVRHDILVS